MNMNTWMIPNKISIEYNVAILTSLNIQFLNSTKLMFDVTDLWVSSLIMGLFCESTVYSSGQNVIWHKPKYGPY